MGYLLPTDAKIRVRRAARAGVTVETEGDRLWASSPTKYAVIYANATGGFAETAVDDLVATVRSWRS